MNQYEVMFLFDPSFGNSFENCETEVRRLMERAEAEIILCQKWDERRLAFNIKGRKRGVYVLVYCKAASDKIAGLERDAKLSEQILRILVIRADDVTPEVMERFVSASAATEDRAGNGDTRATEVKAGERASKVEQLAATAVAPDNEAEAGTEPTKTD